MLYVAYFFIIWLLKYSVCYVDWCVFVLVNVEPRRRKLDLLSCARTLKHNEGEIIMIFFKISISVFTVSCGRSIAETYEYC